MVYSAGVIVFGGVQCWCYGVSGFTLYSAVLVQPVQCTIKWYGVRNCVMKIVFFLSHYSVIPCESTEKT